MSNPNSVLRPAVLNAEQASEPNRINVSLEELTPVIAQIASQYAKQQASEIVQAALNQNAHPNVAVDQEIEQQYRNDLADLDKIPDIVKCLREFSGNNGEFNSWKKSVERVLNIYESMKGTPRYYGILSVIRNKIVGNADIALESYNTPLNWDAISKCLTLHYADKRDLSTLEYQMTSIVQGRSSVQEFYQQVYTHLSLILNKLGCLNATNESLNLLTQTYRDKALDTFIRGLNGDMPKLLGTREPVDLPQALHLCLKLENQIYRSKYAQNGNNNLKKMNFPPPLPPRRPQQNYQTTFYPEITYPTYPRANNFQRSHNNFQEYVPHQYPNQPQFSNQQQSSNQLPLTNQQQIPNYIRNQTQLPIQHHVSNQPQLNNHSQFQPRPIRYQNLTEPMEIDESIRTRQVNYMNRPKLNNRSSVSKNQPHLNMQRTFYLDTEHRNYENAMVEENSQWDTPLNEYIASTQGNITLNDRNDDFEDFHDMHFLG